MPSFFISDSSETIETCTDESPDASFPFLIKSISLFPHYILAVPLHFNNKLELLDPIDS
jgi:hypothetical protein